MVRRLIAWLAQRQHPGPAHLATTLLCPTGRTTASTVCLAALWHLLPPVTPCKGGNSACATLALAGINKHLFRWEGRVVFTSWWSLTRPFSILWLMKQNHLKANKSTAKGIHTLQTLQGLCQTEGTTGLGITFLLPSHLHLMAQSLLTGSL